MLVEYCTAYGNTPVGAELTGRVISSCLPLSQHNEQTHTLQRCFKMLTTIEFHTVRDGNLPDDISRETVLLGASEIPSRLARLLNRSVVDAADFRVFPNREEALDPLNSGHGVCLLCEHIDKDRESVVTLLKAGNFVFDESNCTVVAYVRCNDLPVIASNVVKPGVVKRPSTSSSMRVSGASGTRHRMSDCDYSAIEEVVTLLWPRDEDGVPLRARDRDCFGQFDDENEKASEKQTLAPKWLLTHMRLALQKASTEEADARVLMRAACR